VSELVCSKYLYKIVFCIVLYNVVVSNFLYEVALYELLYEVVLSGYFTELYIFIFRTTLYVPIVHTKLYFFISNATSDIGLCTKLYLISLYKVVRFFPNPTLYFVSVQTCILLQLFHSPPCTLFNLTIHLFAFIVQITTQNNLHSDEDSNAIIENTGGTEEFDAWCDNQMMAAQVELDDMNRPVANVQLKIGDADDEDLSSCASLGSVSNKEEKEDDEEEKEDDDSASVAKLGSESSSSSFSDDIVKKRKKEKEEKKKKEKEKRLEFKRLQKERNAQ
jgi:hypothetical protein